MEKIKSLVLGVVVLAVFAFTPFAHGATDAELQIKKWESLIAQLEQLIKVCQKQIDALEEKPEIKPAPVVKEYRFNIKLPAGSTLKEPKSNITFIELRTFTANLFAQFTAPYNRFMNSNEAEVVQFLKTNGYKVEKDRI